MKSFIHITFGHKTDPTTRVNKHYTYSVMNYASIPRAANLAGTYLNVLDHTEQSLNIITGCKATTSTDHIHLATKIF